MSEIRLSVWTDNINELIYTPIFLINLFIKIFRIKSYKLLSIKIFLSLKKPGYNDFLASSIFHIKINI